MNKPTIFVFGSNTEGRHGKGAALTAKLKYGAIYGQAKGLQGNSYAIITKDLAKGSRSVSLEFIKDQVNEFLLFAKENPQYNFLVTEIGCGLAGFKIEEIAPMFKDSPTNVHLPISFINQITNNE
jgi:hypothetical protein